MFTRIMNSLIAIVIALTAVCSPVKAETASSGIDESEMTDEVLFTQYPKYLSDEVAMSVFTKAGDAGREVMEGITPWDEFAASFVKALGESPLSNINQRIMGRMGISSKTYNNELKAMAMRLLQFYTEAKSTKDLEDYKEIYNEISVCEASGKSALTTYFINNKQRIFDYDKSMLLEPKLTDNKIKEFVEKAYSNNVIDNIERTLEAADTALTAGAVLYSMIQLYIMDVAKLIELRESFPEDSTAYNAIDLLYTDYTADPLLYILNNYLSDEVLIPVMNKMIETSVGTSFVFECAVITLELLSLAAEQVIPSHQEITDGHIANGFYAAAYGNLLDLQSSYFYNRPTFDSDIERYQNQFNAALASLKLYLECAEAIAKKGKNSDYYVAQMWRKQIFNEFTYSSYLNVVKAAAVKDLNEKADTYNTTNENTDYSPEASSDVTITFGQFNAEFMGVTDITFSATANANETVDFTQWGVTVFKEDGTLVKTVKDYGLISSPYIDMWFNSSKYEIALEPDTTYQYQFFCEIEGYGGSGNGQWYYSDAHEFTTTAESSDTSSPSLHGDEIVTLQFNRSIITYDIGAQGPGMCTTYSAAYMRAIQNDAYADPNEGWSYYGFDWHGISDYYFETLQDALRYCYDMIASGWPVMIKVGFDGRTNVYMDDVSGQSHYTDQTHYMVLFGFKQTADRNNLHEADFYGIDPANVSTGPFGFLREGAFQKSEASAHYDRDFLVSTCDGGSAKPVVVASKDTATFGETSGYAECIHE
jgi:hypothetical protein